ncbi:MAG: hypothetical protein ACTJG2_00600 [Candidatus Saccharimonadales bacterium]
MKRNPTYGKKDQRRQEARRRRLTDSVVSPQQPTIKRAAKIMKNGNRRSVKMELAMAAKNDFSRDIGRHPRLINDRKPMATIIKHA